MVRRLSSDGNPNGTMGAAAQLGAAVTVRDGEPRLSTVIVLGTLLAQSSLLHPRFVSSHSARFLRLALLPVNVYYGLRLPADFKVYPLDDAAYHNAAVAMAGAYVAMKAIEWGLVEGPYHRRKPPSGSLASRRLSGGFSPSPPPTAPERAAIPAGECSSCAEPIPGGTEAKAAAHEKKRDDSVHPGGDEIADGPLSILVWTFEHFSSMRGVAWSWGPRQFAPTASARSLICRIALIQLYIPFAFAFMLICRDAPGPSPLNALHVLRVPADLPGIDWVAELLLTACFGTWFIGQIDMHFSILTLTVMFIQNSLHRLFPALVSGFDLAYWPPLFDSPHKAQSLAELWGRRWHTMFRRPFEVCGFWPMKWIAQKLHWSPAARHAKGIVGAFLVSGLMHEFAIRCIAPSGFSRRPYTLFYFLMQPVGMLAETLFLHRLSRPARMVWVSAFSLVVGSAFRRAWLATDLVAGYPAVDRWTWQRWVVPTACWLPKGVWERPAR